MAEKLNLHQKIVEVRKSIDVFKKDTEGYGYNYVSGSQVLGTIKEKMDELGLILYPEMGEVTDTTYDYQSWDKKTKTMKDNTDFVIKGDMKYVWLNADDPQEKLEVPWKIYGQKEDISKAYGSALTYSERYFLLKFFGAPTDEDDPDAKKTNNRSSGNTKASNKQLDYIDNLIKKKETKEHTWVVLYEGLKKRMQTDVDMENWTQQQASQAIKILSNGQERKGA